MGPGRRAGRGFSESLFQTIFETTGTATVIIEEDTTISRVNRGFELLTGYAKKEVEGKKSWKAFTEESFVDEMTAYHRTRRGEPGSAPATYGFQVIDRKNARKYVYATVAMIPGTTRSVASLLDVTGHREAEEALRRSEQRYRGLFETLPDGFLSIDENRRIIESNPAFQAMIGYTGRQLHGMPYDRLVAEKWRAVTDAIVGEELLQSGYSAVHEKEYVRKGGKTLPVEVRAHLLEGPNGGPPEIWVFVRDITKRKRMEKAVRESEEKFRLLLERSADPALLLDGNVFVDCNEAASSLMGCQKNGLLAGLHPADISPARQPDGRLSSEKAETLIGLAMREGVGHFEWVHRDFQGRKVWVDVSLTVIPIYGRPMMFTMWRDITERKKAEARLKESEERYRVAIEHSNDGVLIVRGGRQVYANQRLLSMFGYARIEDFTNLSFLHIVHPDDRDMVAGYVRRRWRGEEVPVRYEFKGVRKDGTQLYLEASVARIIYRGEPASLAYFRDITEAKLAERELRRSEEKYRGIFENAMEGIFQTSPGGRIINANPALARMFGYGSPKELMGKVTNVGRQIYAEEQDRRRVKALLEEHNSLKNVEMEFLHRKGFRIWGSVNYNTIRDESGGTLYYEGTCIDVTQRRLAEDALKRREKELEAKSVNLEEANTALKVLLKHREDDKTALENTILANVKEMVFPYVERLKCSRLDEHQSTHLSILESSLNEIISPISQRLSAGYAWLTRMEIQVATLTRAGKTSKEIALSLGLSKRTIDRHKNNIRKKLGLTNRRVNLHVHLRSM